MKSLALSVSVLFFAASLPATSEEFCGWRPRDIADPTDIRGTTLALSTGRDTYGIYDKCVTIVRSDFGSSLEFVLVNRFSPNVTITSGYALIKSIRTLSSSPPIKISLSRGGGWTTFEKDGGAPKPARVMNFESYRGTVEAWNTAHESPGTPFDFANRLRSPWHAFANGDKTIASSDFLDFWKVDNTFDQVHGVVTNYLIHFDVNTGSKVSPVPFFVFLQPEVKRFELQIMSSPESLSGTYKFVVQ